MRAEIWQARDLAPSERVGVQQALVAMEARNRPATLTEIQWHIGKLLVHWDSNQPARVKDAIMEDWGFDLTQGGFSAGIIAEACTVWRQTQKYRPHVSEIIEICNGLVARDRENIRRARVLLALEAPRSWERPQLANEPAEEGKARPLSAALPDKPKPLDAPAQRANRSTPTTPAASIVQALREERGPAAAQMAEAYITATHKSDTAA